MSRLYTVHGNPKVIEPPKPVKKTHSIHLKLPDWLWQSVREDSRSKGILSMSGYITLLLIETYGKGGKE
jgi:hypothetical protein